MSLPLSLVSQRRAHNNVDLRSGTSFDTERLCIQHNLAPFSAENAEHLFANDPVVAAVSFVPARPSSYVNAKTLNIGPRNLPSDEGDVPVCELFQRGVLNPFGAALTYSATKPRAHAMRGFVEFSRGVSGQLKLAKC
ncbi:hypothetical protein BN2476_110062 [Paraburkholderia piptadeniae]|uniref:Uncharacterized protein n=1 Tax=Paraburkholderia piptadeniae TaxID=1701573 RepID=A0A1N7RPI0_9BURK|nr:hypothetical protein BN2476_110062 [Paraburkholderia piptadeniae]